MSMEKVGTTPSDLRASRKDDLEQARKRIEELSGEKTASATSELEFQKARVKALEVLVESDTK